jgi:radical SAM protein with 4Fe4S-binding SPASM domain
MNNDSTGREWGLSRSRPLRIRGGMGFEDFPYVIGWELTLTCNLRCRHCASSAGERRHQELSLEESLNVCDQFPALLVQEVIFTGGEPLLNPNWETIALRLNDLGIKTGIVSNGLPLTETVVKRMNNSGLKAAGISIDGPESVHDAIRGCPGAFRKALEGIEHLASANIDITIITSVNGLNVSRLDEVYEIVRMVGAWKWQLQPLFPLGRSCADDELRLSDEDFLHLGEYILALINRTNGNGPKIVPADSCGYFSSLDPKGFTWLGCPAGRFECGIMSDGRVKGCLSWPDWTVEGDLRKDDLWTIWFRPSAFKHLREFTIADTGGSCRTCDRAAECRGGCQAMSIAAAGAWHADPYCYKRLLEHR